MDQLQQPYPLQSNHESNSKHLLEQSSSYPLPPSKQGLSQIQDGSKRLMFHGKTDRSKNEVENTMKQEEDNNTTKQEEPEIDHPPQSLLHDPVAGSNSDGYAQNYSYKQPTQKCGPPTNYLDENEDDNHSSHGSVGSEHTRSTVGSTVSIMGSVVGEGDHYDESRLLAVKRRMMQDVEEVLEEEDDSDGDGDDQDEGGGGGEGGEEGILNVGDGGENDSKNENIMQKPQDVEETVNTNDAIHDSNCDTLNISLEVSFHNDTSFLDDRPMNASFVEDHPANASLMDNHLTNLSFLDNHPANSSFLDGHPANTSLNGPIPEGANEDVKLMEDDEVVTDEGSQNLPKKFADFVDAGIKKSRNDVGDSLENPINNSPTKKAQEHESPFRAAFRRRAQDVSKSLSPLSSAAKFDRASASFAIDRAAGIVGQCFSFEDTTLEDDDFLAMPGRLSRHHAAAMTQNYYGLSAVASHDEGDLEPTAPSFAFHAKKSGPRCRQHRPGDHIRLSSLPTSPFRVIRHSRTEDPQYLKGDSIRQTSSFDPWSSPSVGREWQVPPLGNDAKKQIKPFQRKELSGLGDHGGEIDGAREPDGEEKNWKVCVLSSCEFHCCNSTILLKLFLIMFQLPNLVNSSRKPRWSAETPLTYSFAWWNRR